MGDEDRTFARVVQPKGGLRDRVRSMDERNRQQAKEMNEASKRDFDRRRVESEARKNRWNFEDERPVTFEEMRQENVEKRNAALGALLGPRGRLHELGFHSVVVESRTKSGKSIVNRHIVTDRRTGKKISPKGLTDSELLSWVADQNFV